MRAGIAIVLLAIAFFVELPEAWEGLVAALGAALLLTALLRYCPVNHLLGVRSREPR